MNKRTAVKTKKEATKDSWSTIQRLLDLAHQEAHRRMNECVGFEHVLLSALKMDVDSSSVRSLANFLGLSVEKLEKDIAERYSEGMCDTPYGSRPYTKEALSLFFAFKELKDDSNNATTVVLLLLLSTVGTNLLSLTKEPAIKK